MNVQGQKGEMTTVWEHEHPVTALRVKHTHPPPPRDPDAPGAHPRKDHREPLSTDPLCAQVGPG